MLTNLFHSVSRFAVAILLPIASTALTLDKVKVSFTFYARLCRTCLLTVRLPVHLLCTCFEPSSSDSFRTFCATMYNLDDVQCQSGPTLCNPTKIIADNHSSHGTISSYLLASTGKQVNKVSYEMTSEKPSNVLESCPKRVRIDIDGNHQDATGMDNYVNDTLPFNGLEGQQNAMYATNLFADYQYADNMYGHNGSQYSRQMPSSVGYKQSMAPETRSTSFESDSSPPSISDSGLSGDFSPICSNQYYGVYPANITPTMRTMVTEDEIKSLCLDTQVNYNYIPISNETSPSASSIENQENYSNHSSLAEKQRTRYVKTIDFLKTNGLFDVTMKTADLLKRNQALQKELDLLKDELTQYLTNCQASSSTI